MALGDATMHLTFSLESKEKGQLVNLRFSSFLTQKSYLFWRSQICTFQRERVENHFEEESGPGKTISEVLHQSASVIIRRHFQAFREKLLRE